VTQVYKFPDWTGVEDVPALCTVYVSELEAFIADGKAKRFLS